MANSLNRLSVLQGLLNEVAIPFDGIQIVDFSVEPPVVNIQFKPEATQEQINLGNQIKDAFDWRRRRALARSIVATAMGNLTTAQQNQILRHMACEFLRNNPTVSAQINAALSTNLTVDEVDPT